MGILLVVMALSRSCSGLRRNHADVVELVDTHV
jgi:hypothetical protein